MALSHTTRPRGGRYETSFFSLPVILAPTRVATRAGLRPTGEGGALCGSVCVTPNVGALSPELR